QPKVGLVGGVAGGRCTSLQSFPTVNFPQVVFDFHLQCQIMKFLRKPLTFLKVPLQLHDFGLCLGGAQFPKAENDVHGLIVPARIQPFEKVRDDFLAAADYLPSSLIVDDADVGSSKPSSLYLHASQLG